MSWWSALRSFLQGEMRSDPSCAEETGGGGFSYLRLAVRGRGRSRSWSSQLEEARDRVAAFHNAERRAETLLLRCLSVEQKEQYLQSRRFSLVGGKTGHGYMVRYSRIFNVQRDDGVEFCGTFPPEFPIPDIMLGQKLMLESSATEKRFLRAANRRRAC